MPSLIPYCFHGFNCFRPRPFVCYVQLKCQMIKISSMQAHGTTLYCYEGPTSARVRCMVVVIFSLLNPKRWLVLSPLFTYKLQGDVLVTAAFRIKLYWLSHLCISAVIYAAQWWFVFLYLKLYTQAHRAYTSSRRSEN